MASVVKRTRLFEQIADILEGRIRNHAQPPGSELPSERDLMREFGVGRTAVREALFHLQRMGLVDLRPGARARVAAPTPAAVMSSLAGSARYLLSAPEGLRHFQDARLLFETGLVRDAARMATDADIARLRAALFANRESIGDLRRFEETDVAFHFAIATIPQNPIYTSLHSAILEWLVDQRRVTLHYPGQNRIAFDAHAAICEAIAARDPDLAAARMESHLQQIAGLYWQVRGSVA
ncbi:MAG: FCD domain-containing protein [Alphaproteobacteria bacterium]|nr:FCD domain-containing protein [Alphaproteobacteria bacterium]